MKKEAKFWKHTKGNDVQCLLCAHNCKIKDGKRGICGVRENEKGKLYTLIYGSCSSIAADPIEKKPLYHFHPGTLAFSLGTAGCNFKCDHCQNYGISTTRPEEIYMREILPEAAVKMAKEHSCKGIAWTYNEPAIWHEYSYDSAKIAKKEDLYTVYVTNGFLNEAPLEEISEYLDAMNVDIKAFNEEFYRKTCKSKLQPVLDTCERAKNLGMHIEVTYLVIPGLNDSTDEVTKFCQWVVKKLGEDTPAHFSRFHPDYKMTNISATPIKTLLKIYNIAKEAGILYPYLGNVPHGDYENTICPSCGNALIERYGFTTSMTGLEDNICNKCGKEVSIVTN